MAEVVGTAFVRIRALTKDLAKDIQSGLKKGVADADVDAAGADVGDRFAASAKEAITEGLTGAVDEATDTIEADPEIPRSGRRTGRLFGDAFNSEMLARLRATGIGKKITRAIKFDKEGEKAGNQFGKGFAGGLLKGFARMLPVIAVLGSVFSPLIADAAQVLLSYVVGLVAQLGFLTTAAIGAGAAMGSAFAAAGFALIPILLAFKAETPRLERFKKTAEEVGKSWEVVGRATQRRMLPGLTRVLLTSRRLIPVFREFGEEIGAIVGRYADLVAIVIRTENFQRRLGRILQSSTVISDEFLAILVRLGDILSGIFVAALPAAELFARSLGDIVERWQGIINAGEQDGSLERTLTTWYIRAAILFEALGDIVAAIFNILDIGGTESVPLFVRFNEWAENFRSFTESELGQNRIRQIFANALPVMQEVNAIIAEIFDGMFNRLGEPGGTDSLVGGLQSIRDAIPGIKESLGNFVEDMRAPLRDLGDAALTFIKAFDDIGGLEAFVVLITQLFEVLNDLLSIPGFGTFLALLLSFTTTLSILSKLGILPVLKGILAIVGAIFGIGTGGAALVIGVFAAIYTAVVKLKPVFAALAVAIGVVGAVVAFVASAPLTVAIGVMAALGAAVGLLVRNFDTIVAALGAAAGAIGRFFTDPMARLEAFFNAISGLASTVGSFLAEQLGNFVSEIPGFFSDLGELILEAMGDVGEFVAEGLGDTGGAITDFLGDLLDDIRTFFVRLPGRIIRFLGGLGSALLRGLGAALRFAVEGAFDLLFNFLELQIRLLLAHFIGIPVAIGRALVQFGPVVAEAFAAGFLFVVGQLETLAGAVIEFFRELPGRLVEGLLALGGLMAGVVGAAFNGVVESGPGLISGLIAFFTNLPGNIVTALATLGSSILGVFTTAMNEVKNFVSGIIGDILTFFTDLPNDIIALGESFLTAGRKIIEKVIEGMGNAISSAADFATDLAKDIGNAVIKFINVNIIDGINDALEFTIPVPFGPDIPINAPNIGHIPEFAARGIIVNKPTLTMLGEGFKPEVVIPLTDPRRALQLAQQSGLIDILARQGANGTSAALPQRISTVGPRGPLVERITIVTPDPDRSARGIINSLVGIEHAVGGR